MNDKRFEGLLYECGAIPIATVCERLLPFPITKLCKVGAAKTIPVATKPKNPKLWFTVKEAADVLGVHKNTIYRLIWKRKLRATNVATGGERVTYRIYSKDLDAYKNEDTLGFAG